MKRKSQFSIMLALSLAVSLFAGCLTGFAAAPEVEKVDSYADVGEGHWAYQWVNFMTGEGYIHGYPAGEEGQQVYKPDQNITRAEFATILYFMLAPHGSMNKSFTDVSESDWYYEYISKAVASGYMSGYEDGSMKPNAYITREEASSIVYRAFEIEKYTNKTEFADENEIAPWAEEAIMSLAEIGVIVGYTGNESASRVQPKANIKRAEVASLLANADKFHPARVILSETPAVSFDAAKGATVGTDMVPKNVSDNLSVAITVDPETTYTVTYAKGGSSQTVPAEDFAKVTFTSDELKKANLVINFPNAKAGDKVTVKLTVTDNALDAEDKVVGEEEYTVTFEENVPTPTPNVTPSPTPGGSIPGGGGTATKKFTVNYVVGGVTIKSEEVRRGSKITAPVTDKVYEWYTDETLTTLFDTTTGITDDITLYGKVIAERDRVVEALQGYQAMKDKTTSATENVLSADSVNAGQTTAYDEAANTWWTNDMLAVIVSNDLNKDTTAAAADDIVTGKDLASTYNDVARYVVDKSATFAAADVTANKLEYVKYFRAMVSTIDKAANDAIDAYKNALTAGKTKEEAYADFQTAAVASLGTALTDESLPDTMKDELKTLALGYVAEVLTNAGGLGTIKTELEKLQVSEITTAKLAEMLNANAIYPVQ